jgi:hypothetical protein
VDSIQLYSQMVSCVSYGSKPEWHSLLQLLMLLTSANVSQVSSMDQHALLTEEVLFVWALGLCLTPDKLVMLAAKYRSDGEAVMKRAVEGLLREYAGCTEGVLSRCVDRFISIVENEVRNPPLTDDESSAAMTRANLLQAFLFVNSDLRWAKISEKARDALPTLDMLPAQTNYPGEQSNAAKIELLLRGTDWRATRDRLQAVVEGLGMALAFIV